MEIKVDGNLNFLSMRS